MKISDEIIERINKRRECVAQAIHDGDWATIAWNAALVFAVAMVAVVLAVCVLALMWKILGTLLGKIIAVPLVLLILGLSYKMNLDDSRRSNRAKNESSALDTWADGIYEYVRDAMFLVFRAISEYTNIVTPARASVIEFVDNPYTVEDGYVVFHFLAKVCGPIDIERLKADLTRTLRQMHRAHELNGIPRDLTEINGSYYCPLQIIGNPQDFGDYIQISVVFATEKTVKLTHARKMLKLESTHRTQRKQGETLTDDEL